MSIKSLIQQGVFVTAAFFALVILAVHPAEAEAQTGTVLAGPFTPTGPTGNGRCIAFDGIDLYYTITADSNIYQIDTAGILLNTVAVPAGDPRVSSGGPLAWDGLYLWTVDYSNALVMYRINPATGATVSSCNIAAINPGHPALPASGSAVIRLISKVGHMHPCFINLESGADDIVFQEAPVGTEGDRGIRLAGDGGAFLEEGCGG